jgi:hypothetical protein
MIKVDRSKVTIPDCLRTDIESAARVETDKAKIFFEKKVARRLAIADGSFKEEAPDDAARSDTEEKKKKKKEESFEFKVYREAKPALKELFKDKCGYCEIDYGGAPSDIEHFRPKGEIDYLHEGTKKTYPEGYYWLAADWDNLIYACQHCNRGETHDHQEREGATIVSRVSGKANFFPLSDESRRLKACDPVDGEEDYRLLLDPCRDEPTKHLRFHRDGFITAKCIADRPSARGKESIFYYGLSRVALRDRRKHTARELLYAIGKLKEELARVKADPSRENRASLAATVNHIRTEFLDPSRPFLAMAWQFFRERVTSGELISALRAAQPKAAPVDAEMCE